MRKLLFFVMLISSVALSQTLNLAPFMQPAPSGAITYTTVYDTTRAANRDAYSQWSVNVAWIKWGQSSGQPLQGGVEFQLNIPQGKTIDTCFITVTEVDGTGWSATADTLRVRAFAIDNAAVFAAGGTTIEATQTTGTTSVFATYAYASGLWTTPNLATVLQPVISRAGWVANNYAGFVFDVRTPNDGHINLVDDYEATAVAAERPRIKVVYH